jgi:hypothetical protein
MKSKPVNMVQTLLKLELLLIGFSSCLQAKERKFMWAKGRINTRLKQLDLILRRIEPEMDYLERARQEVLDFAKLKIFFVALPLDIETFYVAVRSIMDDVAILTPFFYPKGKMRPKSHSFSDQFKWYKSHPDFDPSMTNYLETQLGWFDELKEYRDGLLHRQCDILPISVLSGKNVPQGFAIIDKDKPNPYHPLKEKLSTTLQNLLAFLNFYSSHFKDRLPNDWPCYKDIGGREPAGSVDGLEFLKRWSE